MLNITISTTGEDAVKEIKKELRSALRGSKEAVLITDDEHLNQVTISIGKANKTGNMDVKVKASAFRPTK